MFLLSVSELVFLHSSVVSTRGSSLDTAALNLSSLCDALVSLHRGDLLLPRSQHLIEWISADRCLDAVHPLIFLLSCRSRDAVESVISLHHSSIRLCLTSFDHLILVVGYEELKGVRFLVLYFTDAEVFQWNNTSWLFISSVLKVVKTVICENKPSSFPSFNTSS